MMSSIYVHIPFCHAKCAYCDFYSSPGFKDAEEMIDAICKEYTLRKDEIPDRVSTVYIGGGTPSMLPDTLISKLIHSLPTPSGEFTVEVNPEDVTIDMIKTLSRLGINRVSMGVQSLIDAELKAVGRRHTAEQALSAASILRECGISNISLDLIYGLPGQTFETWIKSVKEIIAFRPEHISAYILSYEPGTRLTAMLHAGKIEQADDELIERMYDALCSLTAQAGYEHYEISNFALPGFRARHNSGYWHGVPYLGLGPSAHSFDGCLRRINPSSTKAYIRSLSNGTVAFEIDEETDDNRFNDLLVTRLRTREGLPLEIIGPRRKEILLRDAAPLVARGEVLLTSSSLSIPENHWLTSDHIISSLMQI